MFEDFVLFCFLMWTIFNVSIELDTILLLLYVFGGFFFFFGREACGIPAPPPGIEPSPPASEGEAPNTGPPGKSLPPEGFEQKHDTISFVIKKYFLVSFQYPALRDRLKGIGRWERDGLFTWFR